ncbi:MAG: hypothetical protein R3250_13150, partial [Melioribacteraceae bacterium]|nr:hypothetical protein [Melioribacteraceae bacterium]
MIMTILTLSCSTENSNKGDCINIPTLTTDEARSVSENSAMVSGKIIATTCDNPISQGFVYDLNPLPKTTDNVIEINGRNVSTTINNLTPNTRYYVRTYFVNEIGTYYGNEITFNTLCPEIGDLNFQAKVEGFERIEFSDGHREINAIISYEITSTIVGFTFDELYITYGREGDDHIINQVPIDIPDLNSAGVLELSGELTLENLRPS